MSIGEKIARYRDLLSVTEIEFSENTGISLERLSQFEKGRIEPSGDEILIIADYFRCDYNYFISNQKISVYEQTDKLFRKFGKELSKNDKWVIQEVLFLAENEHYLDDMLGIRSEKFSFVPNGHYFKDHGIKAAEALRKHFQYKPNELSLNVYQDFRQIGIKIYRKRLENSNISGIYINHPVAGDCIIVNYTEDTYRQRFTAAHEAGHAIFDKNDDINISFSKWDKSDLKEVRANTFSSYYLCPVDLIDNIPENTIWSYEKLILWSKKILANPKTLLIALKNNNKIDQAQFDELENTTIDKSEKIDPELAAYNNTKTFERVSHTLENGISMIFLIKCFRAYENNLITFSRIMELLNLQYGELIEIFRIFNKSVSNE